MYNECMNAKIFSAVILMAQTAFSLENNKMPTYIHRANKNPPKNFQRVKL